MIYYFLGYGAVALALAIGLVVLEISARDRRRPFPDDKKLLREPGHSLREKLAAIDRGLTRQLLICVLVGLTPLISLTRKAVKSEPATNDGIVDAMGCQVVIGIALLALFTVFSYARRRRNLTLGLFGERLVAEHLEPLKTSGHRVFHDLPGDPPANRHKPRHNIDHVVIGPAGVFAIETKTRRQGRTRVGIMAHEIIYDGRALAYPWGEDRHGLEQAQGQAEWLAAFLERELGRPIPVHPLLVFPGWTILRKDHEPGPVNVLSPQELPSAIEGPPASGHTGFVVPPLDPAAIDLVARLLETRCRDVEF